MPYDRKTLRILQRRNREADRDHAAAKGFVRGAPIERTDIIVYLWVSRSVEGELARLLKINDETHCFLGYDYFGNELSMEKYLKVSVTRSQPEVLRLLEADPVTAVWRHEFLLADPTPPGRPDLDGHDCGISLSGAVPEKHGTTQVFANWATQKADEPDAVISIVISCGP